MIPITRLPEPSELELVRWWRLARLRQTLHQHRAAQAAGLVATDFKFLDNHFVDYKVEPVKADLRRSQYNKCAYCERWEEESVHPVEHFRPKNGAVRSHRGVKPRVIDRSCYWWLAWTWENLLYSCGVCNCKAYKGNRFLINGTPLAEESYALDTEDALLIDPTRHDPLDHIKFIPTTINDETNWKPVAKDAQGQVSAYGLTTIRVLGLDRPDLIDLYNAHVSSLEPSLLRIENAITGGQTTHITACWEQAIHEHVWDEVNLGLDKPFAALSYDVLCHRFSRSLRAEHHLPLPRPGQRAQQAPLPPQATAPLTFSTDQQRYSQETRWAIRAVGKDDSAGHIDFLTAALRAVLFDRAYIPMNADQLCALLSHPFAQPLATVEDMLRVLQGEGAAVEDGQGMWSRSP